MTRTLLIAHSDRDEPASSQRKEVLRAVARAEISPSEVTIVSSQEDAEAKIAEGGPFALAVIHLRLHGPEADIRPGLAVISHLREKSRHCGIIALTSGYSVNLGKEAIWAGANDFVSSKWTDLEEAAPGEAREKVWVSQLAFKLRMWRKVYEPFLVPAGAG